MADYVFIRILEKGSVALLTLLCFLALRNRNKHRNLQVPAGLLGSIHKSVCLWHSYKSCLKYNHSSKIMPGNAAKMK